MANLPETDISQQSGVMTNGGNDHDSERRWRERVAKLKVPPAKTSSGIELDALYTENNPHGELAMPGEYPFTRGVQPTMYRGRLWTMRQYSGFGTASETNQRYRWLLEQGQTGISVALDLPTQLGMDSDDPMAIDDVGRVGVAIDTLADMEELFAGIPLGQVSASFTINSTASILLAMYLAVAEKQGVAPEKIAGTIQNDILKEYVSRGTWIFPAAPALRLIVDTVEHCVMHAPRFNAISVAGAHFRDAGATAVQELAYTLADGITYVQACVDRGLSVDQFGRLLSFYFYTHNDLFEEVAKYRAGRRLWARIMKDRFGANDPSSQMFRFGVVCGGSTLTAQQPFNNVVRVAYQLLASVLGGVQSVFTAAWDEPFAIPTEQSAELALRTQQVLAYETNVPSVVDPLGGSYFIEALTDKVEAEVRVIIDRIEAMGGMVPAIEKGMIQREIAQEAYRHQMRIESGEQIVVGVNKFARLEPEREQLRGNENMMPSITEAIKAYASIGEICAVLRERFGTYQEPVAL